MGKQSHEISNGGRKSPFGISLQNGLGIENWPAEVQDELRRVHPKGNYFIPDEELLIAGLDGRPLLNSWGNQEDLYMPLTRDSALLAALDYELPDPDKQAADDFFREAEAMASGTNESAQGSEDHPLAILEDSRQYYSDMYPWLFGEKSYDEPVRFHGTSCVFRMPGARKHPYSGKKPKQKRYGRQTIRTAYLDRLASRAEMVALIAEAEMAVHFDKRMGAR